MALLASIVCWSDKVQWDVISSVIEGNVGGSNGLTVFGWLARSIPLPVTAFSQ